MLKIVRQFLVAGTKIKRKELGNGFYIDTIQYEKDYDPIYELMEDVGRFTVKQHCWSAEEEKLIKRYNAILVNRAFWESRGE